MTAEAKPRLVMILSAVIVTEMQALIISLKFSNVLDVSRAIPGVG